MPGFSPKAIVIDGRGHMFGRLASIVAKLILNGNKVSALKRVFLLKPYEVTLFIEGNLQTGEYIKVFFIFVRTYLPQFKHTKFSEGRVGGIFLEMNSPVSRLIICVILNKSLPYHCSLHLSDKLNMPKIILSKILIY